MPRSIREVVYALFGRADSASFEGDPASLGNTNGREAVPAIERMGGITPPEFRSSSNCLEGTQTGQGDDDRSNNQLAAAMLSKARTSS
jgi:hypothetical protein